MDRKLKYKVSGRKEVSVERYIEIDRVSCLQGAGKHTKKF